MKKNLIIFAFAALLLSGCGDTSKIDKLVLSSTSQTEKSTTALTSETAPETDTETKITTTTEAVHETDTDELIDLTVLDSNMVYAQVFDMVNYPETYIGQPVRAKGTFAYTEYNGKDYFAVLIADATACCSQGMEFVLSGDYTYPDDYPEIDSEIVVEGVFNTYEEDGYRYCQLKDAVMTIE